MLFVLPVVLYTVLPVVPVHGSTGANGLPVHGVFGSVLPGFRLQKVTHGVGVGEELGVGVEGHRVHCTSTPADL